MRCNSLSIPPLLDDEELTAQMVECTFCEVRFGVILGEDFLEEGVHHCPFCGEYIVDDDQ